MTGLRNFTRTKYRPVFNEKSRKKHLKDKQLRIFTVNFWVSEVKKPQLQAGETQGRRNYPTTFML